MVTAQLAKDRGYKYVFFDDDDKPWAVDFIYPGDVKSITIKEAIKRGLMVMLA
jgi:hypothetical protein